MKATFLSYLSFKFYLHRLKLCCFCLFLKLSRVCGILQEEDSYKYLHGNNNRLAVAVCFQNVCFENACIDL